MYELNPIKINSFATHPLQTWEWGEFRKEWGNEIVRTQYKSESKKENSLLITFSKIPHSSIKIGTALKGPKPTKEMLNELTILGQKHNAIFIKLEPNILKSDLLSTNYDLLQEYCVPGKTLFTPTSFWIDLTKSEDELFASFSSKTRYNIRLAQRKGVTVVEDNSDCAFNKYLKLTFETAKRQGFFAHNEKYHRLMWMHLYKKPIAEGREPIAHLLTALYKGQIITTWILFVWNDFLYYPYGASSDKYKQVMANNLIMWEAIRLGRNLKLKTFDLWGREPGKGFTKFKEGYNPKVVEFVGTWDLIINKPIYFLYRISEKIRWNILKTFSKLVHV